MSKIVEARVTWLASKASMLPDTKRYITVAKFKKDKETWEKEAWSIVVEFAQSPAEQGNPSYGQARFLVENAPEQRLFSGETFELYEGKVKVAEVSVE